MFEVLASGAKIEAKTKSELFGNQSFASGFLWVDEFTLKSQLCGALEKLSFEMVNEETQEVVARYLLFNSSNKITIHKIQPDILSELIDITL